LSLRATCTATAPEVVRTFRTYATAQKLPPSTPGNEPPPENPHVTAMRTKLPTGNVLSQGKVKAVTFRWGANKELRDAVCDFAGDSRHANPWAADLYAKARAGDTTTLMPSESSPGPGYTSSGAPGKTTSDTTPCRAVPASGPLMCQCL